MGIRQVYWDEMPAGTAVRGLEWCAQILAVWPAPVDADACFAAAGFKDFDDSDEEWDRDWREIIVRALRALEECGTPVLRERPRVYDREPATRLRRFFAPIVRVPPRPEMSMSVLEWIALATSDDRFGDVLMEFASPAEAGLLAADGHPILWLGWRNPISSADSWVGEIAGGLPRTRTELTWEALIPRPLRREGGLP